MTIVELLRKKGPQTITKDINPTNFSENIVSEVMNLKLLFSFI